MADKCFRCISSKISDDMCSPHPRCYKNKSPYPTSRGSTIRNVDGDEQTFTGPKTASELLKQYLNYCLVFPDISTRPWAALSPERKLFAGHKVCLVDSSTVQNFQYDLLQDLHGLALANHNSGGIVSWETHTCNSPAALCMDDEEKLRIRGLGFHTTSEDEGMKDFNKSSTENEKMESLARSVHSLKYVEKENGKHNLQRAVAMPIRSRIFAAWSDGWSPKLESVKEIESSAENI